MYAGIFTNLGRSTSTKFQPLKVMAVFSHCLAHLGLQLCDHIGELNSYIDLGPNQNVLFCSTLNPEGN